jgi:hypothetical protein
MAAIARIVLVTAIVSGWMTFAFYAFYEFWFESN